MGKKARKKEVSANSREIAHKSSNEATVAFPDVCKTPSPAGPVPIPYPNIAKSSDTAKGAKKVKADGNPVCTKNASFEKSKGDEPGSTNSSEWKKVEPLNQKIINMVKEHPVLTGVIILIILAILWVLVSNILFAPKPFETEEPIFSLNFWFS
jgi:hypothetical protein